MNISIELNYLQIGLFFKKYSIDDFENINKFDWELTTHLVSVEDFQIMNDKKLNFKYKHNYLIILSNLNEFNILKQILIKEKRKEIKIKIRFPYFEEKYINELIFNEWRDFSSKYYDKLKKIDKDISKRNIWIISKF